MKKKNNIRFKRFLAYLVDMFIVTIISSMFAEIELINPYLDKYESVYQDYTNYVYSATDSMELLTSDTILDLNYYISYYGVITSIITLIITILYFVVFQYFNKGKTIGKAIMKIKVVNEEGNKPTIVQFLLRSIIINSLVTTLVNSIMVIYLSKDNFLNYSMYVEYVEMGLLFVTCGMIILRNDGRGLHDLFAKTNVVYLDNVNYVIKEETKDNIEEDDAIKSVEDKIDNLVKKNSRKKK